MADIETRLFRYFAVLAEERHFSRAAHRLNITPPTLTHQIKKLERLLGARLVERKGNTHVALTQAGLHFSSAPSMCSAGSRKPRSSRSRRSAVKRDDDFMTILTYVAMGYGIGVIAQTMTRINIPNVVFREIATNSVPKSAIAFVYGRNDSSPQTDLLIKHMRSHALRR